MKMERLRKSKIKINDKVGRSASLGIKKKQWKQDDLIIRIGIWQVKFRRECRNIYA